MTTESSPPGDGSVHCISVPTPFAIGSVSAYLIEDDPLTLIDSGPNSVTSFSAIERAFEAKGHALADLGLVLVTHQHLDHLGLTAYVAEKSGAEVVCLDRLAPYAADFPETAAQNDQDAAELMSQHGVPATAISALRRIAALSRFWGSSFVADRALPTGSTIELRDRKLTVIHAPGHSPSDTLFFDEARKALFAGDHLLPNVSSNALVSDRLPGDPTVSERGRWRPALLEYLESLASTRALELDTVYPGHGRTFHDHRSLIDERFARHRSRAEAILAILNEGPRSAYSIAESIWKEVAVAQAYLTLSEVLGHIDLLLQDNRVVEHAGIPTTFSAL